MKKLIFAHGPLAVGVNADSLQYLASNGRFPRLKYCSEDINHAVTIVGWTEDGYWIIKNSYGQFWGAGGYFYMPMLVNKCGINTYITTVYY